MENYYNYSPEIPNGDDNPESNMPQPQHEAVSAPESGKRRRRQKANENTIEVKIQNPVKEKKVKSE